MNGTSREELHRTYMRALIAIQAASDDVADANPNGRDYYMHGPTKIGWAMEQHEGWMASLRSIAADLEAILIAVEG